MQQKIQKKKIINDLHFKTLVKNKNFNLKKKNKRI